VATTELAMVGAGPAGLAAAVTAARAGVHVTLVDEYPRPGGQYLKGTSPPVTATEKQGRALLHDLAELDVELRTETLVWGIEGLRLALHTPHGLDWLEARTLVLATGARELVIPFPGWTLPGVMTLGAAQILAKEHGILPGRRVLLAGSGPLLLSVANELVRRGAEVVAVLEACHLGQWFRHAPAAWGNWDRLREGWHYLSGLRRARVPYRLGRTVIRALGSPASPAKGGAEKGGELQGAIVARLDRQGHPIPGSEETVEVDALCLGFGFLPNVELTQLAGCVHEFNAARGGWVPKVDERMETTVADLFVAGETAGVGGAGAAMMEGRIAGLTVARRLGYISENELARELTRLAKHYRRLRRFGTMLNTLFAPGSGLYAITTDETPICRCEEVSAEEVRAAVARGVVELDALKTWTRVGQGTCQGRTCGPLLARLIVRETGRCVEGVGVFHVRPPLKPVPLSDLALEMCE
jgi:NADPH-dependent 2,4-dienoyl-CoA reductase/sulfur reductase-like enzyme/bacterioferritin-associated ferredoxin